MLFRTIVLTVISLSLTACNISGSGQKGPFKSGSAVSISQLDNQASPIASSTINAQVTGSQGRYSINNVNWNGWTELQVSGQYFNEFTNADSSDSISLSAITRKDRTFDTANVHLFSHLAAARIRQRVADGENSINAWKNTQTEMKQLFGLSRVSRNVHRGVEQLSLIQGSGRYRIENANLLLFTGSFLATGGDATALQALTDDFADDAQFNGVGESAFNAIANKGGEEGLLATLTQNLGNNGATNPPNDADMPELPIWVNTEITNVPPTADAGADTSVQVNSAITIDGNGTDTDGTIDSYSWTDENGTEIATTASFSYTPTSVGTDTLTLTVTDDDGATGVDTVNVEATPIPNEAPTADAGADTSVQVNSTVTLTGSGTDTDGSIASYSWTDVNGIEVATTASFSYTPTSVGTHTLTLTVTDDNDATGVDTVNVEATPIPNEAPTADAGADTSVQVNSTVTLTGNGTDTDGSIAGYSWSENGTEIATTSSFDYTPTSEGTHTLTLTVTDDDGAIGADTVVVEATLPLPYQIVFVSGDTTVVPRNMDVNLFSQGLLIIASIVDGNGNPVDAEPTFDISVVDLTTPENYPMVFSFTDPFGRTITKTLTVTVQNFSPIATGQSITVDEDTNDNPITLVGSDANDGDTLTYSVTQPGNGILGGVAPNVTYTPNANYAGSDSFTFTVSDGIESSTATINITVTDIAEPNQAPVANAQSVTVDEDTADNAITLTGSDADGDTLTFAVVNGPSNGTLSGTAPNFTYTPSANYFGPDSLTFTVSDGTDTSTPATVNITVTDVAEPNQAPVADAQSVTVDEDTADNAITLTGSDADGDTLTFAVANGPSNGTLSGTAPNLTYTPTANFFGSDSFTFTVSDGIETSTPATVNITVTDVAEPNQAPVANAQSVTVDEDTADNAITLTGSDADGDTLTFAVVNGPSNGALSGTAPNLTYTPSANYFGSDSFTFTVSDGTDTSAPATVSITVTDIIDAQEFNIAIGDVVSDGQPSTGAGNIEAFGSVDIYTFTATAGQYVYFDMQSNSGFGFAYNSDFIVKDASGATVVDGRIHDDSNAILTLGGEYTITVTAHEDRIGTYQFQLLTVPPPQEFNITIGDVVSDGQPSTGAGNIEVPGSIDVYTFTATAGQNVYFDMQSNSGFGFAYNSDAIVKDASGATVIDGRIHDDSNAILTLGGEYTMTVSAHGDRVGTYQFQLITIPDPQEFTIAINDVVLDGQPETGAGNIEVPGSIDIYTFTATAGQNVYFDMQSNSGFGFAYNSDVIVTDASGAIVIDGRIHDDSNAILTLGGEYTMTVSAHGDRIGTYQFQLLTIPDPQEFTISINDVVLDGQPEAGAGNIEVPGSVDIYTFTATAGQEVSFDMQDNSGFGFAYNSDFIVKDASGATVVDGRLHDDSNVILTLGGEYTITVSAHGDRIGTYQFQIKTPNQAPVANAQSVTVDEGTADNAITLTGSDADGDTLTFAVVNGPSNGTLSGTAPNPTYTPTANFFGSDSFTFTVSDGIETSTPATVNITVTDVAEPNQAPVANAQSVTVDEDTADNAITLTGSDADGDALTFTVVNGPSNGALSGTAPNLTYAPTANYFGSDSFTFTVSDGTETSAPATVSITITSINDLPTANAGLDISVRRGETVTLSGSGADTDGTIESYRWTATQGNFEYATTSSFDLDTSNLIVGDIYLQLTVTDNESGTASDQVKLTILPALSEPAEMTFTFETPLVIEVGVYANRNAFYDYLKTQIIVLDQEGNPHHAANYFFEFDGYSGPVGSDADDWESFDPTTAGVGLVTISYLNEFGDGIYDVELDVVINQQQNSSPIANTQALITVVEDSSANAIALTGTDADGDTLTYAIDSYPLNGSLDGSGQNYTYTPDEDYSGADSFTFTVTDGTETSAPTTINIMVTDDGNHAPVASSQAVVTVIENSSNNVITLAGTDADGDTLTYAIDSYPSNGSLDGSGQNYTYTPDEHFFGTDSFSFVVNDGDDISTPETINITVTEVPNNVPVANTQGLITVAEDSANNAITLTGTDADGDSLTYAIDSHPANGSLDGSGQNYTYTPNEDFSGTDSFSFTVYDGDNTSTPATINIMVTDDGNHAPVASPQAGITVVENSSNNEITLTGTDEDNDSLTYEIDSYPANGTLDGLGQNYTYTPNEDYTGADSFSFVVNDGDDISIPVTINITVIEVPDAVGFTCPATSTTEAMFVDDFIINQVGDLNWTGSTFNAISVQDIESAFNHARANDESSIAGKALKMPEQNVWDTYSDSQKALFLINSERCARGIRPYEGIDLNVVGTPTEAYADLLANPFLNPDGGLAHDLDRTPLERLEQDAGVVVGTNADFFSFAENLASMFTISGEDFVEDIHEPVSRAVYAWLYDDKNNTSGNYGHRKFLLATGLVENSGDDNQEGLLSVAVSIGETTIQDEITLYKTTAYTVLNGFDPDENWDMSNVESVELVEPDSCLSDLHSNPDGNGGFSCDPGVIE